MLGIVETLAQVSSVASTHPTSSPTSHLRGVHGDAAWGDGETSDEGTSSSESSRRSADVAVFVVHSVAKRKELARVSARFLDCFALSRLLIAS